MRKFIFIVVLILVTISTANATDYLVTSAGSGDGSGDSWANAMSYAQFETSIEGTISPGDRWFLMGGQTYTLTSTLTQMTDGTPASPCWVIGVASGTTAEPPTTADWATGTDRPLFTNSGAYEIYFDDYWNFYNFRMTSNNTYYTIRVDTGSTINNCEVRNTGISADAIFITSGKVMNCDVKTDDGVAILCNAEDCTLLYNYVHDSDIGINVEKGSTIAFNIIDSCTTGIDITVELNFSVLNNTIYNSTTGIHITGASEGVFINNAITDCTTGASSDASNKACLFDYNNWNGNTTDVSNLTKGKNATAVSPSYTDAAGGDFSLTTGSSMRNAGQSISLGVD